MGTKIDPKRAKIKMPVFKMFSRAQKGTKKALK